MRANVWAFGGSRDWTLSGSSCLTESLLGGVPRCYRPNDALEHPTGAPLMFDGDCDAFWSENHLIFSNKRFSIPVFMTLPAAVGTLEVSTQVSKISTPVCGMVALRGDLPVLVGDGRRTSPRVPCGVSRELALPDLKTIYFYNFSMISNHHDIVYYFSFVHVLSLYWCLLACSWHFDDGEQSCGRTSALCATAPQSLRGYVDLLICFVLPSVVSEHHTERMNATSQPSSFRLEECWVAYFRYTRQLDRSDAQRVELSDCDLLQGECRGVTIRMMRWNTRLVPSGCLSGDCDALAGPMISWYFFQANIFQFLFS